MKNFLLQLVFFICISGYAQNNQLSVIGNNNGVPSQLSMASLKSILNGNQPEWSNGQKTIIALMKFNTDAGKSICNRLYEKSAAEVTKHWLGVSMKGNIDAPVFFNTAEELQNFVASTSGAIGVMSGPASVSTLKTVLVDGKKIF